MRPLPLLLALTTALCACADAPPAAPSDVPATSDVSPEERAFADLDAGVVELVPTASFVASRCAAELSQTWCSPAAARSAALACRARLTADERARSDTDRGCVTPYLPTRDGDCREGATYRDRAACATPVADNCAFYRACLDPALPCGDGGYALGFGEPLCYLFIDRRAQFTPEGQRWLRGVRTCLQRELAALAAAPPTTCDALADAAYASHTRCYTDAANSFCDLPPSDVLRLATLLGPYFRDPRVMAQSQAVAAICEARRMGR